MFKNKIFQWSIFGIIAILSIVICFRNLKHEDRNCNAYDEQMWTSASIASYNMFFKGHERNLTYIDNWFSTYAIKNDLDVFTKYRNPNFEPLKVKFPYDYAANKNKTATFEVEIDTVVFPKKYYQWFDKALWTFGWRAPNMGKYFMGWYIQTFADQKPNPDGYFQFLVPNSDPKEYKPSAQVTTTSFSYAPTSYVELARIPNAIATVFIILAVFIAGWRSFHILVGTGAALWLIFNNSFIQVNTNAGLDSFSILFTFTSILLIYYSLKKIQENKSLKSVFLFSAVTGISLAFAVGSKLNGALAFYVFAILYGLAVLRVFYKKHPIADKKEYFKKIILSGATAGGLGLGTFLFFNPQMQVSPVKMTKTIQSSTDAYFEKRAKKFCEDQLREGLDSAYQVLKYGFETRSIPIEKFNVLNQKYGQLLNETRAAFQQEDFFKNEKKTKRLIELHTATVNEIMAAKPNSQYKPLEFVNWVYFKNSFSESAKLVNERIAYVAKPDKYYASLGSLIPIKYNPMDGLLALLGLLFSGILAWKFWTKNQISFQLILFISFAVIWYGNTDFIWQDWSRYFVPLFPLYSLLIVSGIYYSVQWLLKLRKKA